MSSTDAKLENIQYKHKAAILYEPRQSREGAEIRQVDWNLVNTLEIQLTMKELPFQTMEVWHVREFGLKP